MPTITSLTANCLDGEAQAAQRGRAKGSSAEVTEHTNISGRCRLQGEARQGHRGKDGQRGTADTGDSCPPADTHHGTQGPVTLQRFSLQMLGCARDTGICRRCQALPTLTFAWVFAGTTDFSLLQGGMQCFFWRLGVWFF